jgi:hypothetical protein
VKRAVAIRIALDVGFAAALAALGLWMAWEALT